jgi:hypothetical protein
MSMEKVWHSGSTPVILIPETAIGGEKREGANMKIMKPGKRPYCQNNQSKRAGGMAQVGKHLHIKHKALSSISSTATLNKTFIKNR